MVNTHGRDADNAIVIALGANRPSPAGPPLQTLRAALDALEAPGLRVSAVAPWVTSPAWPAGSGPDYVNGAARLETTLAPMALLERLLSVEAAMGRERGERWGPRVCDLDLLCHGQTVLPERPDWSRLAAMSPDESARCQPDLVLPHPRLAGRAFALIPLAAVAPGWRHPVLAMTASRMAERLTHGQVDSVKCI